MSYCCYLCLLAHSGVQHILCFDFVLFFLVLCAVCWLFLRMVHLWLHLSYSLTFIKKSLKFKSERSQFVKHLKSLIHKDYHLATILHSLMQIYFSKNIRQFSDTILCSVFYFKKLSSYSVGFPTTTINFFRYWWLIYIKYAEVSVMIFLS